MASPITSSQWVRLLTERLRKIGVGAGKGIKSMIPVFYTMLDSDSAQEEFYNIGELGDIPEFNGKMSLLGLSPGYHTKIEPIEYGGMLNIERKFIDDKKYKVMENYAEMLMKSGLKTREKKAARIFVNAFSAAFDFMTSEEGVALCSDSHTTKSGTSTATGFDNTGTSALNKTSLAAAKLTFGGFRNDISERVEHSPLTLVIPENLEDMAYTLMETKAGLDTAEGNENPLYKRHKIIVHPRLDDYDTNNWFLVDEEKMKRHLFWIDRIKSEVETIPDFMTKMIMVSIYFRMAYGFTDWRWILGQNVS